MKKEQKERYEEPHTRLTQVCLESGICSSSADVKNPNDDANGQIEKHKVNEDFGFDFTNANKWD